MKLCPTCKMISDADVECPFCNTSLTYVPSINADTEKYKLNKYLLLYLLKNCWFSLVCLIITSVILALNIAQFGFLLIFSLCLAVASLLVSLLQRKLLKKLSKHYSVANAYGHVAAFKFITGLLSVTISLLTYIVY